MAEDFQKEKAQDYMRAMASHFQANLQMMEEGFKKEAVQLYMKEMAKQGLDLLYLAEMCHHYLEK